MSGGGQLSSAVRGSVSSRRRHRLPDYRITCFFVDRRYRHKGVAALALRGALDLIARAGGGVVEAYPQDTEDKKVSASFLYNGTRTLFEDAGFR